MRIFTILLLLALAIPAAGRDLLPEERKTLTIRLAVDVSARKDLSRWKATLYGYNISGLRDRITLHRMDRLENRHRRIGETHAAFLERDGGYVFVDHPGKHSGVKELLDSFLRQRKMPVKGIIAGKVTREFRHGVEPGRFTFWLRFDAVQASLQEKTRPNGKRETTRLKEDNAGPFWLEVTRDLQTATAETITFHVDWTAGAPVPRLTMEIPVDRKKETRR